MARIIQLRNIKRALKLEPNDTINYVLSGRVSNFRAHKSHNFIDLVDGSTHQHLQVVVKRSLLSKPELGSYLTCQGHITSSPGQKQDIEFKVNEVKFASECNPDEYPLAASKLQALPDGWYRQNLHLRPRAPHFASLLRVRSELELSLHMILKQMDFFKVQTPILSANDSEASSDLFLVQRASQRGANQVLHEVTTSPEEDEDDNDHNEGRDANAAGMEAQERLHNHIESNLRGKLRSQPGGGGGRASGGPNIGAGDQDESAPTTTTIKPHYFHRDVYMVTSAQLHLESLAASLSRVYCLSAAFRAENSLSRRHLCEFTMLEAEEANVAELGALMDRVEALVKFAAQFVADISEFSQDFHTLLERYSNQVVHEKLARSTYIRMTYAEAMRTLAELHAHPVSGALLSRDLPLSQCHYGHDLSARHERHLLNYCQNVPIFITNFPRALKPFYMKPSEAAGDEVLNFDLIAPVGGEICGGSLREDDPDRLRAALRARGAADNNQMRPRRNAGRANEEEFGGGGASADELNRNFQWYLELRKFGTFPHGGFGIGLERLIQSLLGVPNIRDTLAFPRWPGNCSM